MNASVLAQPSIGPRPRSFLDDVTSDQFTIVARGGPSAPAPLISAIVPTRNRRHLIAQTITALQHQDLAPDEYEIIVVDNASDDGTVALLHDAAEQSRAEFTGARMHRDCGPAVARNVGVMLARGRQVAFTDSDCVPSPDWLRACIEAIGTGTGIVQGRTAAMPGEPQPLFNHFIETTRLDGSFSTSNVCYPREAVVAAGGFDAACAYWEDVDLGWRVRRLGWDAHFAEDALVHHQVMPLSAWQWVTQPRRFANWPAKAARYPEFRRHLLLGVWVHWTHVAFDAFVAGIVLSRWRRAALLLTLPYLVAFAVRRRLTGRWPLLKAAAHFAYDCVAFSALVAGSIRHRRPVL